MEKRCIYFAMLQELLVQTESTRGHIAGVNNAKQACINPCADHGKGPTWHLENPLSIHISKPQQSLRFISGDERYRLLRSVANGALHRVIGCARFHVENVSF